MDTIKKLNRKLRDFHEKFQLISSFIDDFNASPALGTLCFFGAFQLERFTKERIETVSDRKEGYWLAREYYHSECLLEKNAGYRTARRAENCFIYLSDIGNSPQRLEELQTFWEGVQIDEELLEESVFQITLSLFPALDALFDWEQSSNELRNRDTVCKILEELERCHTQVVKGITQLQNKLNETIFSTPLGEILKGLHRYSFIDPVQSPEPEAVPRLSP